MYLDAELIKRDFPALDIGRRFTLLLLAHAVANLCTCTHRAAILLSVHAPDRGNRGNRGGGTGLMLCAEAAE